MQSRCLQKSQNHRDEKLKSQIKCSFSEFLCCEILCVYSTEERTQGEGGSGCHSPPPLKNQCTRSVSTGQKVLSSHRTQKFLGPR